MTRKIDYALVALAFLGQRRGQGEGTISARSIAQQFGLPLAMLTNLLKDLAQAQIIVSTRGPQGGYALAAEADRVTVLEVIHAVEGPVRLVPCMEDLAMEDSAEDRAVDVDKNVSCALIECCPIRGPIRRLHDRITGFLGQVTVADLIDSRVDVPVEGVGA